MLLDGIPTPTTYVPPERVGRYCVCGGVLMCLSVRFCLVSPGFVLVCICVCHGVCDRQRLCLVKVVLVLVLGCSRVVCLGPVVCNLVVVGCCRRYDNSFLGRGLICTCISRVVW